MKERSAVIRTAPDVKLLAHGLEVGIRASGFRLSGSCSLGAAAL